MGAMSIKQIFKRVREGDLAVSRALTTYSGLMRVERCSFIRRLNFEIKKMKNGSGREDCLYEKKLRYIRSNIPKHDLKRIS